MGYGAVGMERAGHPLDRGCELLPLNIRLGLPGEGLHSGAQLLLALHSDQAVRVQYPETGGGLLVRQALQTRPTSAPHKAGRVAVDMIRMPRRAGKERSYPACWTVALCTVLMTGGPQLQHHTRRQCAFMPHNGIVLTECQGCTQRAGNSSW